MEKRQSEAGARCVLLSAGPVADLEALRSLLRPDDVYLAADGGLRLAQALGVEPALLVADFDSLSEDAAADLPVRRFPTHKDVTDTMAAAQIGLEMGYREFLLLGATGGRLDHTMANVAVLLYLHNRGAHAVLADEHNRLELRGPGTFRVAEEPGCKLSLLPYAGDVTGITLHNAVYPLHEATLTPDDPLGVSNAFAGGDVEITFQSGILMIFLSKD